MICIESVTCLHYQPLVRKGGTNHIKKICTLQRVYKKIKNIYTTDVMMLYSDSSKPKKKIDICVMDSMCKSKKDEKIWLFGR